jgi:hypothetical protein
MMGCKRAHAPPPLRARHLPCFMGEPLHPRMPPIRRQRASEFSWPPDPVEKWTYIDMPPKVMVSLLKQLLNVDRTEEAICDFFVERARASRAYLAYYDRWIAPHHNSNRDTVR